MKDELDPLTAIPDPFVRQSKASLPLLARPARRSASRGEVRLVRAVALLLTVAYYAEWIHRVGPRADFASLGLGHILLGIAVPLLAAVVGFAVALRTGATGLGAKRASLIAGVLLAPTLFTLGTLFVAPGWPQPGDQIDHVVSCLLGSTWLTLGPLVFAAMALRGAFPTSAVLRTACLGAACGALSATTMSVACSTETAIHILLTHGTAILAGGLVGALVGRFVTRV